ncbi:protein CHUP1, chloroplastic-like [Vicia villosa]|uniref:protein CHUP1, chloroplastic-like n=1 Tax=Vicia villosa TaxID=3911 RepID=UPI00273B4439|nr:protein CHUP1, chloroplastic-like [Vicia villosa]
MMKRKKHVKPILVNIGLAFGFTFAGFLCSRLRINEGPECTTSTIVDEEEETQTNESRNGNSPIDFLTSTKQNGDRVEFLLAEFDEIIKEVEFEEEALPRLKVGSSRAYACPDKDEYEQEIHQLKNMVRLLQDKEQNLEVQLLEYYGLKEQETVLMELENRLKISNMQVEMFNQMAKNLQSENRGLREHVADYANVLAELDAAKEKTELLNKEIRREAEQSKEQIVSLQQRVAKLEVLESEVEELRKSNSRLQIENSDLTRRFDSTQILANDAIQENERLRKENDDLMKQIEQLQSDRHSNIEELVYTRWINVCMRQELQNQQPPHIKTIAKDPSKSLSPTSEKKSKQLKPEYADTNGLGSTVDFDLKQWSSSQSSSITDSGDYDHFSSVDNSPASRTIASRQNKFFCKLRRLILGKDRHHHHSQVSSRYQEDSDSQKLITSRRYSSFDGEGSLSDFLGIKKSDLEKYAEALKDFSANDKHQRRGRSTSYS